MKATHIFNFLARLSPPPLNLIYMHVGFLGIKIALQIVRIIKFESFTYNQFFHQKSLGAKRKICMYFLWPSWRRSIYNFQFGQSHAFFFFEIFNISFLLILVLKQNLILLVRKITQI